ncbi:hypothetical protein SAMN05192554_111121 [Haloarchaeobius iranensis]|uniref:Uncharacterized protein n=1 Tax=Haloarchaeobius iranensis TaxID=996166 RepID=A0A1G9XST5_9EURY|nr:hypothetical protein SAMN05192554_111121 [Haloarchaeobius iranensis]
MDETNSLVEAIRREKETTLWEVFVHVLSLMMGGIIGGKAFQVAQADNSIWYEMGIYTGLLIIGIVTIYIVRLSKPIGDGITRYREKSGE